jgi:GNAT superfamily N-acetyltransferase
MTDRTATAAPRPDGPTSGIGAAPATEVTPAATPEVVERDRGTLTVRAFRFGDTPALCALLGGAFAKEYAEQGLDISGFRRQYQLVGIANAVLSPLRLDFFKVAVALWTPADGGRERLVGTMTSFPADREGLWYQGFGAVDPTLRRQGVYKRVIRFTLEDIARRGARVGGGEIREGNDGALRSYRDNFAADVLPRKALFLLPPPAARTLADSALARRLRLEPLSNAAFANLPEASAIRSRFVGGFLVEHEAHRSLTAAVRRWLLPPLTVATYAHRGPSGRLAALVRVRTHWPARIQALDAVWLAPQLAADTAREILAAVVARYARQTSAPIRLYAEAGDELLREVAPSLGFRFWCNLFPIRTDVARALAVTDATGSRRDRAAAAPPTAPSDPSAADTAST